jgi:phosphate-selective porin OprO and OprP
MRILPVAGASTLVLASSLLAQQPVPPAAEPSQTDAGQPEQGPLDTLVPAEEPPAATPKPTGDPILDRLNSLEARVNQLEAENAQLRQDAELSEGRIETVENRAAKAAQFGWVPTISDPNGNFTFKPRGVFDVDAAVFHERSGGYDFNNGTAFRRARLGFEGSAFKWFNYRLEVDFAGNAVNITDAYLQYTKIPKTILTLGQHKAPFGLESNNSDNYNTFIERGMFTNAFGNVGAERRIGISAAYAPKENINIAAGFFGDNESISRSTTSPVTDTPDESWGVNGRATWEPVFDTGKILHLGLSGFYRTSLKSGDVADAVRLSDRPNIRIDNGNIADSGVITNTRSLRYGGVEAAGVLGPITVAGEAGRLWLDRFGADNEHFTGYYGYATYMLTGETRSFKGGNFDRIRPFHELGSGGGLGAFELALRYDHINLSNTPVAARAGNDASSITGGLNWYFNPYAKLMFNWVHFWGENTPLDPIGSKTRGDAFATRLHVDF